MSSSTPAKPCNRLLARLCTLALMLACMVLAAPNTAQALDTIRADISLGTPLAGQHLEAGQYGYYTFNPSVSGQYIFEVNGDLDAFLRVDYQRLDANDPSKVIESGILVQPFSGNFGGYALECTLEAAPEYSYEFQVLQGDSSAADFEVNVHKAGTVEITLDANGGAFADGSLVKTIKLRESVYNTPKDLVETFAFADYEPILAGHKVLGWDNDPNTDDPRWNLRWGSNYSEDYSPFTITQSETLYAQWTDGLLVTFDANGGTNAPAPMSVYKDDGTRYDCKSLPTRDGYAFLGWALTPDAVKPARGMVSEDHVTCQLYNDFESDITVYAVWTEGCRVSFDGNGSDWTRPALMWPIGEAIDVREWKEPTREGYEFVGYSEDKDIVYPDDSLDKWPQPTTDTTIYAIWTPKVKVVFHYNPRDYYFETQDNDFTWLYSSDDRTEECEIGKGNPVRANEFMAEGDMTYTLAGWTTEKGGTEVQYYPSTNIEVNGPMDLYPVMVEAVKLTLYPNGGIWSAYDYDEDIAAGPVTLRVPKGTDFLITEYVYRPADEDPDHIFMGYAKTADAKEALFPKSDDVWPYAMVNVDKETTLYAVWKAYTLLTFHANGGTYREGDETSAYVYPFSECNLREPGLPQDRDGYFFIGYDTDPNAATPRYAFDPDTWQFSGTRIFEEDTDLYAIWRAAPMLTFDANGGKIYDWNKGSGYAASCYLYANEAGTVELRSNIPQRDGYQFLGYANAQDAETPDYPYDDEEGELLDADGNPISEWHIDEDTTLFAVWIRIPSVTLHANNDTGNEITNYAKWSFKDGCFKGSFSYKPKRYNYFFLGWALEPDATEPDGRCSGADNETITVKPITEDMDFYAVWQPDLMGVSFKQDAPLVQGSDFTYTRVMSSNEWPVKLTGFPRSGAVLQLAYADGSVREFTLGGDGKYRDAKGEIIEYDVKVGYDYYDGMESGSADWTWPGKYASDGSIVKLEKDAVTYEQLTVSLSYEPFICDVQVKWSGDPMVDLVFWNQSDDPHNNTGKSVILKLGETLDENAIPIELAGTSYSGDGKHTVYSWQADPNQMYKTAANGKDPSWWFTHGVPDSMRFSQVGTPEPCDFEETVLKEATETTAGERKKVCKVCGHEEVETIPATGTEAAEDQGKPQPEKQPAPALKKNQSLEVGSGSSAGTYKVTKAATKTAQAEVTFTKPKNAKALKKAAIPATVKVNGQTAKVTAIAPNAFKGCKKLTAVTVGKNVKTIGKAAFKDCKKLSKMTIITKSLKKVGAQALKGSSAKLVVKVPKAKKAAYVKLLKKGGLPKKAKVK